MDQLKDALTEDFQRIIFAGLALIDVRAPVEFRGGSIPGGVNLPLLLDEERHLVGRCYRDEGAQAAVSLGNRLVAGDRKEERIKAWSDFLDDFPAAYFYCARGGLRSTIAQKWLVERTGRIVPRLAGGYKAMRNYLLAQLEPAAITGQPVILGGRTGTGKTELLRTLDNSIDLEGLANHRGSSFGRFISPQPGQADFENRLACALVRFRCKGFTHLILEDEGRHVGQRFLPKKLWQFFATGPVVILEASLEERIETIYREYVVAGQQSYCDEFGENRGMRAWLEDMVGSAQRIGKRLGKERLDLLVGSLNSACVQQRTSGATVQHKAWITMLLTDYYDPMYDYQIENKQRLVSFRGNRREVSDYLKNLQDTCVT